LANKLVRPRSPQEISEIVGGPMPSPQQEVTPSHDYLFEMRFYRYRWDEHRPRVRVTGPVVDVEFGATTSLPCTTR